MIIQFTLTDYQNDTFEIERSAMTGKVRLTRNGVELEQSDEKGKPFLLRRNNGTTEQLFVKVGSFDIAPFLELNGKKIEIVEKLKWYQYVIGGLPSVLIFIVGGIGGGIAAILLIYNFSVFRGDNATIIKYVKVIGITILGFIAYLILTMLFLKAVGQYNT